MTLTAELCEEHQWIMRQASALTGLASSRVTRDVAEQARGLILGIDRLLVTHLKREDEWLYPALAAAPDLAVQQMAQDCIEDMGGILGAWIAYRDRWTGAAILADPARFRAATEGVVGALALRVEKENVDLYPLMEGLAGGGRATGRAA